MDFSYSHIHKTFLKIFSQIFFFKLNRKLFYIPRPTTYIYYNFLNLLNKKISLDKNKGIRVSQLAKTPTFFPDCCIDHRIKKRGNYLTA